MTMARHIKILLSVAILATTIQATIATPNTGIYVGAGVGGAFLAGDSNLYVNRPIIDFNNYNRNLSAKNIAADLFVGYGKRINCIWLAVEALASFASLDSKDRLDISGSNGRQTLSTQTKGAWGGAINLGYYVNTTTNVYIKLGFESRRFRINFVNPQADVDPFPSLNKNYNSTAFVPGFGVGIDLTPRFSLRTEYRIALHRKKTAQASNNAPAQTSIETKPTVHSVNVGLVVKI